MAETSKTAAAGKTSATLAPTHTPNVAGSVIEAKDGMGGSNFIRIQKVSATGKF